MINFPSTPILGQTHSYQGTTWQWMAPGWKKLAPSNYSSGLITVQYWDISVDYLPSRESISALTYI